MARYANAAKRPSSNLGDCEFESRLRHCTRQIVTRRGAPQGGDATPRTNVSKENMRRLGIGKPNWP